MLNLSKTGLLLVFHLSFVVRDGVVVAEVAYSYDEENGSVFTLRDVAARETYTFDSIDLIAMEIYELLY